MLKMILFVMTCLFATNVTAENEAIYDPETGIVEIPEVIIVEQPGIFSVMMQQTEGLNFTVTEVSPVVAESNPESSGNEAFYDPGTGIVEIPATIILGEPSIFFVTMQETGGLDFNVTEVIPFSDD